MDRRQSFANWSTFPFDDDIHYEALSYTWGSHVKSDLITLGGTAFPVTSNLFAALRALRNEHADSILWIDAVCINQDDIFERSQEVLRMLRIYQRAERVVVWLGETSDDSTFAIDHLLSLVSQWNYDHDRMAQLLVNTATSTFILGAAIIYAVRSRPFPAIWTVTYYARLIPASTGLILLASRIITFWFFFELGLCVFIGYRRATVMATDMASIPEARAVKALESFFMRAWFRRVWVVQEIAAAQDAMILCGPVSISLRDMCIACDQIERRIIRSSTRNPYADSQFQRCRPFRDMFNPNKLSSKKSRLRWDLQSLLIHFSNFGATRPHDKVYGLLGLASEFHHQEEERGAIMAPDYTLPLNKVYAETAKFVIMWSGRLDILRACDGFHRMPGLPSWAPDWNCDVFRKHRQLSSHTKSYHLPSDLVPAQPVARFLNDSSTMIVRGFIIGHFIDSGEILFSTNPSDETNHNLLDPVLKYYFPIMTWIFKFYIVRCCIRFCIRFCVGFCLKPSIRLFNRFYPEAHVILPRSFDRIDEYLGESKIDEDDGEYFGPPQVMANLFPLADTNAEERILRNVHWESILNRTSIAMRNGHTYTPNPQVGDLICMFIGAAEAYIVRKTGGDYELFCSATFGPFTQLLWEDCEREHREGTLKLQYFRLR